jgi:hypothetical protein
VYEQCMHDLIHIKRVLKHTHIHTYIHTYIHTQKYTWVGYEAIIFFLCGDFLFDPSFDFNKILKSCFCKKLPRFSPFCRAACQKWTNKIQSYLNQISNHTFTAQSYLHMCTHTFERFEIQHHFHCYLTI